MLKPKPKILSFILIAIMLAAALGGLCLVTDTAEAAPSAYNVTLNAGDDSRSVYGMWEFQNADYVTYWNDLYYDNQASGVPSWAGVSTWQAVGDGWSDNTAPNNDFVRINRAVLYFDLTSIERNTIVDVDIGLNIGNLYSSSSGLVFCPTDELLTAPVQKSYYDPSNWGDDSYLIPRTSLATGTSSYNMPDLVPYLNDHVGSVVSIVLMSEENYNIIPPTWTEYVLFNSWPSITLLIDPALKDSRTFVWDGEGADDLASNDANWRKYGNGTILNNVGPSAGDDVVFNATSTKSCTWDLATEAYSFTIATGYTGTVTQGSVDITIGAGGFRLLSGIFNPNSLRMVYCDGDVIYGSSGSVLPDKLGLQMEPGEHTLSLAKELRFRTLINKAELTHLGNTLFLNNHVNDGTIYSDGVIRFYYTDVTLSGRYIGNGELLFSRKALVGLNLYTAPDAVIDVNLNFRNEDDFNPNLYMLLSDLSTHKSVQVQSIHGEYPEVRIDANGHSLTADSVTVGTGGNILWGEGTHRIGGLDTSAGASDFETSQVIMEQSGIISLGPGQSFYDLTVAKDVTATLGSDVEVTHYAIIYGSVVRSNYDLILAHIINSYPTLTLEKFDNYLYRIVVVPGAQLTMLEYPSWLTWNPHQLTLSGKAIAAGTFTVRLMAEFPGAQQEYQNYTITVAGLPPTPGWSGGQPITDYGTIMIYIIVGAVIAFILLVFAFMGRRR